MSAERAPASLEAYERWAENYPPEPHNPVMRAEQQAMMQLWPSAAQLKDASALDLACGTGRYSLLLNESGARNIVSMDFSEAMLGHSNCDVRVRANMMSLPFADAAFDVVVSGLAAGHASNLQAWMREVARVLKPGGVLLYSDFHPEATRAGLTRSFKDRDGQTRTVPHCCYDVAAQTGAAEAVGLTVEIVREIRVGLELHEAFLKSESFYRNWHGVPIVLVVRARK